MEKPHQTYIIAPSRLVVYVIIHVRSTAAVTVNSLERPDLIITTADKNVTVSAVFTKRWTKLRPKVRLFNHDSLLTLNCHHRLKII